MSTEKEQNNPDIVHLYAEIDTLNKALVEKQNQLISMETACLRESDRQAELEDSIIAWQDKYDRLYESHKRVQKVNQSLEDKLLKLVDRNSGERAQLTSDVATLSVRLAQANYNISKLQREIERYKNDINLAIQLLQCNPDSFVPQKVSSLPLEIQSKVSAYMRLETNSHSDSESSTNGVGVATSGPYKVLPASDSPPPLCPFPPTAMVYSMRGLDGQNCDSNDNSDQMISPSIMAKYLEDELKSNEIKHCDTCKCSTKDLTVLTDEPKKYNIGTQTVLLGENNSSLCLRCNSNLNSPSRTNSPYIMKLVKSSDSVISETKSSVSDFNDADKLFTPAKKDDLMVNPILGHHRLCDRTTISNKQQQTLNQSTTISNILSTKSPLSIKYNNKIKTTDTANLSNLKYQKINDNDNDDRDLIDLNKYSNLTSSNNSNKSPLMAVNNDINLSNSNTINNIDGTFNNRDKLLLLNSSSNNNSSSNINHNNNGNANSLSTGTSQKNGDSSNLLIDNIIEDDNICNSNVQGKNFVKHDKNSILIESDEKNRNDEASSCGNLQTTITGSTNSLWSRTSSSEGARIFENFNRNLIKTIKAENPKYRGPRLCALRIQNGSTNILLDSVESEVKPIVYTRRQRFLDEELDDTKDVITSKISMVASSSNTINSGNDILTDLNEITTTTETTNNEVVNEASALFSPKKQQQQQQQNPVESSLLLKENFDIKSVQQSDNFKSLTLKNNQNTITNTDDRKFGTNLINFVPSNTLDEVKMIYQQQITQLQQQKSVGSYSVLTTCDNSINSSCNKNSNVKTITQTNSTPSNCCIGDDNYTAVTIDNIQENVSLRRQQLTRVAEWVQNNSQMEQCNNNNQHHSGNNINNTKNSCSEIIVDNNFSNNSCNSVGNLKVMMPSNGSSSLDKLSNNEFNLSIKNKKSCSTNSIHNNIDAQQQQSQLQNKSQFSSIHQQQIQLNDNPTASKNNYNDTNNSEYSQSNYETFAQNNANKSSNYFIKESSNKPTQLQKYLNVTQNGQSNTIDYNNIETANEIIIDSNKKNHNQEDKQVDFAQMEYNVKQFLLKQNEWSMYSKSTVLPSLSPIMNNTINNYEKEESKIDKFDVKDSKFRKYQHQRTETNL